MTEQRDEVKQWPRLGALVTIPGKPGAWSVWSRGALTPSEYRRWWLIPVDADPADRDRLAELRYEYEFAPYTPAQTEALT